MSQATIARDWNGLFPVIAIYATIAIADYPQARVRVLEDDTTAKLRREPWTSSS
jgi:hypothetical protein